MINTNKNNNKTVKNILLVITIIIFFSCSLIFISEFAFAAPGNGHDTLYLSINGSNLSGTIYFENVGFTYNQVSGFWIKINDAAGLYYDNTTGNLSIRSSSVDYFEIDLDNGSTEIVGPANFNNGQTITFVVGTTIDGNNICTPANGYCGSSTASVRWVNAEAPGLLGGNITTNGTISVNETYTSTLFIDRNQEGGITTSMITDGEIVDNDINSTTRIDWTKIDVSGASIADFDDGNISYLTGVLESDNGGLGVTSCGNGELLVWSSGNWSCSSDTSGLTGTGVAGRVALYSSSTAMTTDTFLLWDNDTQRLKIGTAGSPVETLHVAGGNIDIETIIPSGSYGSVRIKEDYVDSFISGNYVYSVVNATDTLLIYDITDETNMALISSTTSEYIDGPSKIVVAGDYAYISATIGDMISIYDISDRNSPTYVGSISSSSYFDDVRDFELVGNFIYTVDKVNDVLTIVDVSDKSNPVIIKSITDSSLNELIAIDIEGDYAYVSGSNVDDKDYFAIINITDKDNLNIVGTFYLSGLGTVRDLHVNYPVAFLSTSKNLEALNITSLTSITELDNYVGDFDTLILLDNYIIAADSIKLTFFELTDSILTELGTGLDGLITDLEISGNKLVAYSTLQGKLYIYKMESLLGTSVDTGIISTSYLNVLQESYFSQSLDVGSGVQARNLKVMGPVSIGNGVFTVTKDGMVGIRTSNPSEVLTVNGTTVFSDDVRVKNDAYTLGTFTFRDVATSSSLTGSDFVILQDNINLSNETTGIVDTSKGGSGKTSYANNTLLLANSSAILGFLNCSEDEYPSFISGNWSCTSGSSINGTGTANYVAYFNSSDQYAQTNIYVNDTNAMIGIETITPNESLVLSNSTVRIKNPINLDLVYCNNPPTCGGGSYEGSRSSALLGSILYTSFDQGGIGGMKFYDVSNPNSPKLIYSEATPFLSLSVTSDRLYAVAVNAIKIYDVSQKDSISLLNSFSDGFWSTYTSFDYPYIYVGSNFLSTTGIYDVSNDEIKKIGSEAFSILEIHDGIGFGNSGDNLVSVDLSDPYNLVLLDTISDASINNIYDIQISEPYAYVVSYDTDAVTVVDISDPSNMVVVDSYSSATNLNQPTEAEVYGNYLIVLNELKNLTFFDISKGGEISFIYQLDNAIPYNEGGGLDIMSIQGTKLYVYTSYSSSGRYGFNIYDLPSLKSPQLTTGNIKATSLDVKDYAQISQSVILKELYSDYYADIGIMGDLFVNNNSLRIVGGNISVNSNTSNYEFYVNGTAKIFEEVYTNTINTSSGDLILQSLGKDFIVWVS